MINIQENAQQNLYSYESIEVLMSLLKNE